MAKQERIEQAAVCREIGARTGGDILIGVVGPVRTGKSTLIKQFMEKLVYPENIILITQKNIMSYPVTSTSVG